MGQKFFELWALHSAALLAIAKNLIAAAAVIALGVILSRGTQKIIIKAEAAKLNSGGTTSSLIRGIIRYGILVICIIMILNIFGVNTTSLITVLGAAGVAVGLALKDTLGNIAAGIILLALGNFRIGEFIEFGTYMGTVKEIHLFNTILETPDGIYISAPNSSIWGSPLKNYTRNGKRRMDLSIGIAYSDSVDAAFQVMQNIIAAEPGFLTDPAPQVILQSIEDGSATITIRAWTSVQDYWNIYWEKTKTIKAKIEAAGLHIPLPQRDVHIVQK
ncbi:MAG: mechanosensitive ion channel family protein [Treponema sp.]|jgi:small conductance mechanosensitive channel|nr:mechanosensitive ion channel family protein [Treponema sp.]